MEGRETGRGHSSVAAQQQRSRPVLITARSKNIRKYCREPNSIGQHMEIHVDKDLDQLHGRGSDLHVLRLIIIRTRTARALA